MVKRLGQNDLVVRFGTQLSKCEKLPVLNFKSVECEIPEIERNVLIKYQQYRLDISYDIKLGRSPKDLSVRVPCPLSHSRWLTTVNRVLRLYLSIENQQMNTRS
ncbi:hypothetical protein AVEN_234226-1 [Araneus ventricosus]|uniref:Uncharacterized protein n=1 Tax=Araneus ventricosus TaxID=182803 RepID=A0A4Y2A7R8_ARAVE|nr:hypothetical protein AVEN_234226-1 [Araneus ventricosus]